MSLSKLIYRPHLSLREDLSVSSLTTIEQLIRSLESKIIGSFDSDNDICYDPASKGIQDKVNGEEGSSERDRPGG